MPLKLTAGVSKKLGLPNYSSVGATCHVELELDSGLIEEAPEAFLAQVRQVYAQCAASVEEELARHLAPRSAARPIRENPAEGLASVNGHGNVNGRSSANGRGSAGDPIAANGQAGVNGNGHLQANTNGNGQAPTRANSRARSRPSARQLEYVQDLAGEVGMDAEQIEGLCQRLFEKPLGEISGGEASGLIRALQELREDCLGSEPIDHPEGE